MSTKRAAIPADLAERQIGELSATDFLAALHSAKVTQVELGVLADKKKYELWVEETQIDKIAVKDLVERLRGEKKKLELEKNPRHEYLKRAIELEIDPREMFIDPVVIEEIATQVAAKLGR